MNEKYIYQKGFKKVSEQFKGLVDRVKKGSFDSNSISKADSIITVYYETLKRAYERDFGEHQQQ